MSDHITEWLNPYLDRELKGSQLRQVEAHLAQCRECSSELASLRRLSSLLQQAPAPEFTPAGRFAAQVNLRLPNRPAASSGKRILELGWWMVPVGLLAAWVFLSTSVAANDMLSLANRLGLLNSLSGWLAFGSANSPEWSAMLGQMGLLGGAELNWAELTETLTRTALPHMGLQVSIALLYLAWIATWWTRRTAPEHKQLVDA